MTDNRPFGAPSRRAAIAGGAALAALGISGCEQRPGASALKIDGDVVAQGEQRYEEWRTSMVWQMAKPYRKPKLIVRPKTNADISTALAYARENRLRVAVKSGGHHIWANFLRSGGMLIDMWDRRGVEIDAASGTAWVEPSVWARDLQHQLIEKGFAFPVGHCGTLGMGGFLLGGGLGVNWTSWGGMSCYSVAAAEVVTADGRLRPIDAANSAELFWAARGGGNGFPGVVTRFKLKLYPAPRFNMWSMYVFPIANLEAAVRTLEQLVALGLTNAELLTLLAHSPMAPKDAPPEAQKVCVVRANVFAADEAEARATLGRVAAVGAASGAVFKMEYQPSNFEQSFVESMDFRQGFGFGRFGVDTIWTNEALAALTSLAKVYVRAPSWKSHVVVSMRPANMPAPDAACVMHGTSFIGVYTSWDGAANDGKNIAWSRACSAALKPHAAGHYINEIDAEADPAKIRRSFTEQGWARLRKVRETYDPTGVFQDFFGLRAMT